MWKCNERECALRAQFIRDSEGAVMKQLLIWGVMLAVCLASVVQGEESIAVLEQKAAVLTQQGKYSEAVKVLSEVVAKDADHASAYYWRGRAHFCLGQVKESLADFDKYVVLQPKAESRQWERGISCYYAAEFERGAKQFELYQTYHDQDVENSVWRYLCVAKSENVDAAKKNLLPITADPRIPMMTIYAMYQGNATPEKVLEAAKGGKPGPEELNQRLFYANLYIGLWHEAAGRNDEAKTYILESEKHKIGHYMWDVAHIHADRLRMSK